VRTSGFCRVRAAGVVSARAADEGGVMPDLLTSPADHPSAALAHRALDAAVTGIVIVDMTRPDRPMT